MDQELTFEEQIAEELRRAIIKEIKTTSFVRLQYEQKKMLPNHVLEDLWATINWVEVIEQIRPAVQTRICNTIVGAMETEIKTDVKKLLAVSGVREKLRIEVYPKLMEVLNGKSSACGMIRTIKDWEWEDPNV